MPKKNEKTAQDTALRQRGDQVYGYTIKQIEDVLSDTSSWNEWKNNIENRYENDTEEHLDRLFRAYE